MAKPSTIISIFKMFNFIYPAWCGPNFRSGIEGCPWSLNQIKPLDWLSYNIIQHYIVLKSFFLHVLSRLRHEVSQNCYRCPFKKRKVHDAPEYVGYSAFVSKRVRVHRLSIAISLSARLTSKHMPTPRRKCSSIDLGSRGGAWGWLLGLKPQMFYPKPRISSGSWNKSYSILVGSIQL